jgi:hypothetical protein
LGQYSIHEFWLKHKGLLFYLPAAPILKYKDYTAISGHAIHFVVRGTMMMERKINTQIPNEGQTIEW